MATGRSTQLTRQIGEHLVAAELGRMGIVATPFAGNVPQFDLLVATETGRALPVQVKAINGPSWQFNAAAFVRITIENEFQTLHGPREDVQRDLICILVLLRAPGSDEFFTLKIADLQKLILARYKGGRRPKNPDSTHCAIWPKDVEAYRGWSTLQQALTAPSGA